MLTRNDMINMIHILDSMITYQDEVDELNRELEKITNDNVREAVKDRRGHLTGTMLYAAETRLREYLQINEESD